LYIDLLLKICYVFIGWRVLTDKCSWK